MKDFFTCLIANPALLVGFIGLVFNTSYAIFCVVRNAIKKIKSGGNVFATLEQTYLELKELARKYIYEKEEMYKNVSFGGVKAGAFKLNAVLSSIEVECLKKGVEFDSAYWTDYINKEVSNMKGVK